MVFSGLCKCKSLLTLKLLHSKFNEQCSPRAIITGNHQSQFSDLPHLANGSFTPVPVGGLSQSIPATLVPAFLWPKSSNPWTQTSPSPILGLLAVFRLCPTSMVLPSLANNRFSFLFLLLSAGPFNTNNWSSSNNSCLLLVHPSLCNQIFPTSNPVTSQRHFKPLHSSLLFSVLISKSFNKSPRRFKVPLSLTFSLNSLIYRFLFLSMIFFQFLIYYSANNY